MIYQREIPFVKVVIPLIIGITVGYHFKIPLSFLFPAIGLTFILFGVVAFLKLFPNLRILLSGVIYLFFFLLGITSIGYTAEQFHIDDEIVNIEKSFQVKIIETPKITKRISFRAKIIDTDSSTYPKNKSLGELYVSLEKKNEIGNLLLGDHLFLYGKIRPLTPSKNKYTFDFKNFLKTKGITHQIFLNEKNWKLLHRNEEFSIVNLAKLVQHKFSRIIQKYIPELEESSIVQALVIGSKSNLDPAIRDAYANTGSMHVLAVSGLHVGLIYAFLIFIFRFSVGKSKLIKWSKFWIILLIIWCFTFISGAAPSVIRASTMLSLLLVAKNIQRYPNTYNIIAFTAFCMLIYNPWQLFDVSFQLSFLALLGIVFFHSKIYRSWYIKNWLGDKIWTLTALGISAQLGTFPIAIYYFHQFPFSFWLTGIFVVPFASLILGLGLILLFTHFVIPFLAPIIGQILELIVWLLNALIYLVQSIPGSSLKGIWINEATLLILYLSIFLFAVAVGLKRKIILIAATGLFIGLMSYNLVKKINSPVVNKLHVYHSFKNSRIDYIQNNTSFGFQNENFDETQFINLVEPFHEYLGINNTRDELPNRVQDSSYDGIMYYQINNYKLGILRAPPKFIFSKPLHLDLLIITNNPKLEFNNLVKTIHPDIIIIDGSNPIWSIQKWENDAQEFLPNTILYSTSELGAITINFENDKIESVLGETEKL